jgi:hypothetical protein
MGFDMYNMSNAISQGNMLSQSVSRLNDEIADKAKTDLENASIAAKNAVGEDKELGLFAGIKDTLQGSAALQNVSKAVSNYQEAVKSAGTGGFTEVKTTASDYAKGAERMGLNPEEVKPASAITTSEGTLAEGSDILKDASAAGEEVESVGMKAAGAIGKGVGVLGGIASAGLDIAADVESFRGGGPDIAGDNIGEKIANIGTIGGAALDMVGLIPGFQFAAVLGTGLQVASGVLDAASEAVATKDKIDTDQQVTPPKETQQVGQESLAGSFAATRP